ncbi:MAG: hypothetical protein GC154_13420 [bacterium]|nr:hypothetical protein [bacterium]
MRIVQHTIALLMICAALSHAAFTDPLAGLDFDSLQGPLKRVTFDRYACDAKTMSWLPGERIRVKLPDLGTSFTSEGLDETEVLRFETHVVEYGTGGRPSVYRLFDGGGALKESTRYTYDEAGNLIELVRMNSRGETLRRETFEYDETNRKSLWIIEQGGAMLERHEYSYDEQGRPAGEHRVLARPPREYTLRYTYSEKGERVTVEHFKEDGTLELKLLRLYDDRGRMIGEAFFDKEGRPSGRLDLVLDESGAILERSLNTPKGTEFRATFHNDERGNPIETRETDRNGDRLSQQWLMYQYDEHGNWIQRAAYERREFSGRMTVDPVSYDHRVIEYFD